MRAIALAFVVAAVGCTPPSPESEVASSLTGQSVFANPCVEVCTSGNPTPTDNPWAGLKPGYVVSGLGYGNFVVVGLDATLTTLLWHRVVADSSGVAYYQNLPGTIPFTCIKTIDAGQVGSSNTKTGGGNEFCFDFCLDTSRLTTLQQQCMCEPPEPAATTCSDAGLACGTTTDYCKNVISCGGCISVDKCVLGQCVPPTPRQPVCHGTTCM